MRVWTTVRLGWLVATGLVSCTRAETPIRIGLAGPLSDPVGRPMALAAELAVAEVNATGGVDGRPLELVAVNDWGVPDSAVAVAERLGAADVVAVIGHVYSGTTLAAAPVYGAMTPIVPVITPSSSAPELSEAGAHLFRLCPTDDEHGAALATWVRRSLALDRGTVFYLNDAYGRGVRRAFVRQFTGLGGAITGMYPYLGTRPDVAPFLDREAARDSAAQFVLVAGNRDEAEAILGQLRARGTDVPVLGADGLEGLETAGAVAEGSFLTAAYLPAVGSSQNQRFVETFRARFPDAGPPNQPAAATYDAVHLVREAILQGGATRRGVLRSLSAVGRTLPPYQGVTGVIAFDEGGDLVHPTILIGVIRQGDIEIARQP